MPFYGALSPMDGGVLGVEMLLVRHAGFLRGFHFLRRGAMKKPNRH
jgi:hypothetical protein